MGANIENPGRTYHHGNLRLALIEAALMLVESGDTHEVSLRTAATLAGVSSAAPYRHFRNREALLAAVAAIGFNRLRDALTQAGEGLSASAQVLAESRAYLRFASQSPGLYKLMFAENYFVGEKDEVLEQSAMAAFALLEGSVGAALAGREAEARLTATAVWAELHGIAMLTFQGLIPVGGLRGGEDAEAAGEAVMRLMIERVLRPAASPGQT